MDTSMKTKEENEARVAEEYLSSLSDLTCNSKPLINMLTMLAEENIGCASVIVKVVEQHIVKVPPDIKLPLLYLIDSIVKNVKSTYIHLFSQCIVNIFCDVFEKVNEKVRERMYALRLTWNEVFPAQKLYALDVKVKRIDNNWPITAKQAQPSIHVNPNFLKQNYELKVQAGDVEEILQAKTRELLELKKRKLELELEATKKSLEEQDKQLSKVTNGLMQPDAMNAMPGVRMPGVPPQIMPPGMMPPGIMPQHHMHPRAPHPALMGGAGVPPATLFHPNFHQNRPQQPTHVPVGMMNMPPQNFPPTSGVNKPKVHPVNPALLNTIRHRDPRLARQQQMQESVPPMRGSSKSSSSSSASRGADDTHKADSKSSSSSSSYRNCGSKSSRGDVGSIASESRHTSSSSNERTRKGSSTRDKDKDRKRSESKSSTSSGGSSSSERHKSSLSSIATGVTSIRNSKKSTSTKCDKDAFEIAPLSTTFKRKSSTTSLSGSESSSSSRKKDAKRKTHTSPTAQKHRSRSRSPIETAISSASTTISADRDDRVAIPAFSSKNQSKGPSTIRTDSEREEELKKAALRVEKKNIKIVTDGCLAFAAQTDTDLRQFLNPIAAYAPNLEQSIRSAEAAAAKVKNTSTIAFTPTTTTTSAKVSFKIQKMFNKLDKSTAQQQQQQQQQHQQTVLASMSAAGAATTTTITTTAGPIVLDHDDDMMSAAITSSSSSTTTTTATANAKTVTTANINIMSTKGSRAGDAGAAVGDAGGRGDGVRIGASTSSSVSVGRHNSSDSTEQQLSKAKVTPLSSKEFDVEPMDVDKVKVGEKSDEKKRLSSPNGNRDEPLPKKSKSAKFDALFGDEDVDLRTVIPSQILAVQQHLQKKPHRRESKSPTPPPPPFITDEQNAESWNNLKTSKTPKSTSPSKKSSTLDDVRAKLAKATKYSKLNKSEKSSKDLTRVKLSEPQLNDDSQDANDEKIRTIVAQAQELLETNSINQDQYKNLMQKVMSINESSKLKEAKKRESLGAGQAAQTTKQAAVAEETAEEQRAAAAREAVLKKRIPKLRRASIPTGDNNANSNSSSTAAATEQTNSGSNTSTTRSPIYEERSNDNTDVVLTQRAKSQREKRLKPSKWGEKIDSSINTILPNNNPNQPKPWTKGNMMRPHPGVGGFRGGPPPNMPNMNNMHPQMPWQMQMPPNGGPPFVPPGSMIRSTVPPPPQAPILPIIPLPPSIPKPCNSIDNPQADLVRTITIDGLSKEIRIYDQVAIVFMELDQPREIGFQAGQRSIIIDDQPPIALQFNDEYKTFNISGQPHRLRFGFPSRELYIDDQWYEIYFGGPPVSIPVQNRIHILKAEGPPPQVNIGALRRDLVVGKINMIVDAHIVIPLFLDAKPQTFKLGNQDHTVQFADNLLTVLLDGEPAKVEYGGLPKSYLLGGVSYFIRFGALPQGLKPGQIAVKDMLYVKTEPPAPEPLTPAIAPSANSTTDAKPAESMKSEIEAKTENTVMVEQAVPLLTSEIKEDAAVKAPDTEQLTGEASEPQVVGTAGSGNSAIPIFSATALNKINIDELFQKLVSSGILGGGGAGNVIAPSNKDAGVLPSAAAPEEEAAPQPIAIQPIDLGKSETIKTRQMALVDTLFSGMQCSSCGVRFPPEQTIKYSQHLDWHFRQNRRERDQSRKAHARKWYYDLTDWVQYEEIEDLEEREKNFFEAQQNDIETVDETSNQKWLNSPTPLSCPALPEDVDRACDMCQEKLEQFYHEETEEWHLRNAIRVSDKIYHPLCYEDYKAALNAKDEESDKKTEEAKAGEDMDADDDLIIKIEGDDHSDAEGAAAKSTDNAMDDDDDDVIVLPNEEPSVTEIEDDDEYVPESVPPTSEKTTIDVDLDDENKKEEMEIEEEEEEDNDAADADATGSDVEIQEPHIPFTDLDTYVEKEQPEVDETSQMSFMNVKIKEEPKDDDEDEDDGFEDVGTVVIPLDEEISIQSSEETQTQTITSSTSGMSPTAERPPSSQSLVHVDATEFTEGSLAASSGVAAPTELNTSIDGNPGNEDEHNLSTVGPSPAIPLASLVNKIKINIAKSSITANSNNNNNNSNNTGSSTSQTGAAIPTTTNTLTTNNSMNSSSSSPTKGSTTSDALHTDDDNAENANFGDNTTAQYSNVSAISVVSTIPVLCGGGTMSARTTTTVAPQPAVSSSSNLKSIAANEESSVSTISVIGSYSGSSSTPRYFPPSTTSSAAAVSTAASRRQPTAPPKPSTPPPPEEETPSYELKPALQSAKLKKMNKVKCGVETSGLCSVM